MDLFNILNRMNVYFGFMCLL